MEFIIQLQDIVWYKNFMRTWNFYGKNYINLITTSKINFFSAFQDLKSMPGLQTGAQLTIEKNKRFK